jgi:signal peptidase II
VAAVTPARPPAGHSVGAWLTLLITFTVFLAADLGTKWWTFDRLHDEPVVLEREVLLAHPGFDPVGPRPTHAVVPDLLELRLVLNPGAVFGIGANHRWFFIVFTVLALTVGIFVFARSTRRGDHLAHVALGLILAGGVGNLYDRILIGRVRDFIHMFPDRTLPFGWTWPGTNNPELFPWVFNVADMLLFIGMLGLMTHLNRRERLRKQAEAEMAPVVVES